MASIPSSSGRHRRARWVVLAAVALGSLAPAACRPPSGASAVPWRIEHLGLPDAATVARTARVLARGEEIAAEITKSDPVLGDTTRYHVWRLDAVPGQRTSITLASGRFTPFLIVAGVAGDSLEVVGTHRAREDDGRARVSVEALDRGPFYIFANPVHTDGQGAYTLLAGEYSPPSLRLSGIPATEIRPLERANTAVSSLGEGDRLLQDGSRFQLWRFAGRKGDRLSVTMASTEFEPYLAHGRRSGDSLLIDGQGGAGESGRDAQLYIEIEQDGEHVVLANAAEAGARGRYTLRLEPQAEPRITLAAGAIERIRTLPRGTPEHATLAASDAVLHDRTHYQLWGFEGEAGEQVMVTMRSSVIDPFLYFGVLDGNALRIVRSNDDRGVGTEARIHATLPRAGSYVIVANAVNPSELGPYTLLLERARGGVRLP